MTEWMQMLHKAPLCVCRGCISLCYFSLSLSLFTVVIGDSQQGKNWTHSCLCMWAALWVLCYMVYCSWSRWDLASSLVVSDGVYVYVRVYVHSEYSTAPVCFYFLLYLNSEKTGVFLGAKRWSGSEFKATYFHSFSTFIWLRSFGLQISGEMNCSEWKNLRLWECWSVGSTCSCNIIWPLHSHRWGCASVGRTFCTLVCMWCCSSYNLLLV